MSLSISARVASRAALLACLLGPGLAHAAEANAWTAEAVYTGDLIGGVRGTRLKAGRALDNLDVVVEGDLERSVGWRGATVHAYILNNSGGEASQVSPTLQGVDNIEVSRARTRLYELWIEQRLGEGPLSLKAGLYDLNSEFYVTESSALFIAPSFGIGPEFSSSGANGPSIFPSTSLAIRARIDGERGYVQAAVFNADARTLGDPGGPNTGWDDGSLAVAEAGAGSDHRIALGAWRYTDPPSGESSVASGVYALWERKQDLLGREAWWFARGGVAHGPTLPIKAALQTGFVVNGPLSGRPDDTLGLGLAAAWLSNGARGERSLAGDRPARAEVQAELSYRAQVTDRLAIQPDVQVIRNPDGLANRWGATVGVRVEVLLGRRAW